MKNTLHLYINKRIKKFIENKTHFMRIILFVFLLFATVKVNCQIKKDTDSALNKGVIFWGYEYEVYKNMPARNKQIVDSLKMKGVMMIDVHQLSLESHWMKGKKTRLFWIDRGEGIGLMKYLLFNGRNGEGFQLINDTLIK